MLPSSTLQEDTLGIVRQLVMPLLAAAARPPAPAAPPRSSVASTSINGGGSANNGSRRPFSSFSRLWDLVPRADAGPPQRYVVHAWGARLIDVAQQLVGRLMAAAVAEAGGADSAGGAELMTPGSDAETQLLGRTYVWVDFLALAPPDGGGTESCTEDGELDLLMSRSVVSSCRYVSVKWGDPGRGDPGRGVRGSITAVGVGPTGAAALTRPTIPATSPECTPLLHPPGPPFPW